MVWLAVCTFCQLAPAAPKKHVAPHATTAEPAAAPAPQPQSQVLELATRFDVERFMGLWFKAGKVETPRTDLRTRERYELMLRYDGTIRSIYTMYRPLVNQWSRDEDYVDLLDQNGTPYRAGQLPDMPVTMRISRFANLLNSNYLIHALDADYQWALVQGPRSDAFFVLSRTAFIAPQLRDALTQLAKRHVPTLGPIRWAEAETTN